MYRTPLMEQRTGQGGIWGRTNVRNIRANLPLRMESFPKLFESNLPSTLNQPQSKGKI